MRDRRIEPTLDPPRPRRSFGEWLCRLVVTAFGWFYLFLLALQVLAMVDPFDIVPRPLVGVSLIVIGLPWTFAAGAFPEGLQYLAAAVAPALNWLVLGFLCAWQRMKHRLPPSTDAL
jgi:hypothetical protein